MHSKIGLSKQQFQSDCHRQAVLSGLLIEHNKDDIGFYSKQLPVSLLPLPVKRKHLDFVTQLQSSINQMLVRISNDSEYLNNRLSNSDDFTRKLLEIYNGTRNNCQPEDVVTNLGIFRTDYIIDEDDIKQVEMNTISVSFAGLMLRVQQFHREMIQFCHSSIPLASLPSLENSDQTSVPGALAAAHRFYSPQSHTPAILFLVENGATNVFDMQIIRLSKQLLNIPCHHCVFSELGSRLTIGEHNEMLYKPQECHERIFEISVVYFRTGYVPSDYNFSGSYQLRLTIEMSRAIKCPSIGYQLAGMKYIQSDLSHSDILKRFLQPQDDKIFESVRNTFTQFYPVNEESIKIVEKSPEKYVLKNNLEGGGHNVFGKDVLPAIKNVIKNGHESQYNLMQFLSQKPQSSFVIRDDQDMIHGDVDTELGIYGTVLASQSKNDVHFHFSHSWGHLLRVKCPQNYEAGVMHGDGALSSVYTV